ncbi:hypothetical protein EJ02DRAFT_469174 [Clathrospora elynae]|uniref:Uncharacterized protein n=1 Tax=Clathrospora elynae TaxID=706981 RepID=A0A6A5SE29_9PLEO|nr:hypothetical protein EJ02DRAFT_469174 [Clathrospora elynae]
MRRCSYVWVLVSLSTGVLGGVMRKPCETNATTIHPHHGSRTAILLQTLSSSSMNKPYESETIVPYPILPPSSSSSLILTFTSIRYAVPSPSAEVHTASLSVSSSANSSTLLPTFIYSPLPHSSTAGLASPSSVFIPDYPAVTPIVVSRTVVYPPSLSSSIVVHTTLPPVSTPGVSSVASRPSTSSVQPAPGSSSVHSLPAQQSSVVTVAPVSTFGVSGSSTTQPTVTVIIPIPLPKSSMVVSTATLPSQTVVIPVPPPAGKTIATTFTTTITVTSIVPGTSTTLTVAVPIPPPASSSYVSLFTTLPSVSASSMIPGLSSSATVAVPITASSFASTASRSISSGAAPSASQLSSSIPSTVSTQTPTQPSSSIYPTYPPYSYNPSAPQPSASPISRPTPEPSSALVAGTTLAPSSAVKPQGTGIPLAPSAAGSSGGFGSRGKERVWWVTFFIPLLVMV